jgi:hypothetical protein
MDHIGRLLIVHIVKSVTGIPGYDQKSLKWAEAVVVDVIVVK